MGEVVNLHDYIVSSRVDALISELEEGGLLFSVINKPQGNYLVFEIAEDNATALAWCAAEELKHIFATDHKLQEDIFNYAFAMGAMFQELKSVGGQHDQIKRDSI